MFGKTFFAAALIASTQVASARKVKTTHAYATVQLSPHDGSSTGVIGAIALSQTKNPLKPGSVLNSSEGVVGLKPNKTY